MTVPAQRPDSKRLARAALAELNAPEPDRTPAQLMGGQLAWGESWVTMVEADRDPANAPTMRPHVIAACQQLREHPALRSRCKCGKPLDFLALAAFSTGVLVVSSPKLLPEERRGGGVLDFAPVDDSPPECGWALLPWEDLMRQRAARHRTAWHSDSHPFLGPGAGVIGDTAKRQVFECAPGCGAVHVFRNATLLRLVLQAIADGSDEVVFGDKPRAMSAPS